MTHAPATPGSAGHDDAAALDVIARAHRLRVLDRAVARFVKRLLVFTVFVAAPVVCIATPNVYRFGCRSEQSEAKGNLRALYVAAESYRAEYGHYTTDQAALGWTARGVRIRYDYFVKASGHDDTKDARFEAWAVGVTGRVAGDVWRHEMNGERTNVVNACAP